jgi:hypothetical protein
MRRGTAFESANWSCPGLSLPFFRIAMMRRDISRQHKLLIELESRYPNNVYYAAPGLENIREFDRAYNTAAVARRSVFFSPTDIGPLPDDKSHTLAYKPQLPMGYFFSEPKSVAARTFEQLSGILSTAFEQQKFHNLQIAAREMRENVLDLASPTMREAEQQITERVRSTRRPGPDDATRSRAEEETQINVIVAREIARVDMGIDLLLAQPR